MLTVYTKMEQCMMGESLDEHAFDCDWRVRYAAAVGIGEKKDNKYLPILQKMLEYENGLSLYNQPPVRYDISIDDSRFSERVDPINIIFEKEHEEETLEAWRCRGRVKQAVIYAVIAVGQATTSILQILRKYLYDKTEDHCVSAASAKALGILGDINDISLLETVVRIDEWCAQTEAKKAILNQQNKKGCKH